MDKRAFFTKRMAALLIAASLILTAGAALAAKFTRSEANLSKVVLNVSNMSCSGCISTIKGALAGYTGIKDILVDISSGKAEIYYDREKLKDLTEIEKAITDSGYPAKITKTFTPEDLRKERDTAASKAEYYIASVSGYDISRADFAMELNAARQRVRKAYGDGILVTAQGRALDNRLKAQVASKLIEEGILLQEIKRSGYELNEDIMNSELKKYIKNSGQDGNEFQQSVKDDGYDYDYFKKRFETRLLINRYLDEKVLAGASNQYEKQRVFASWFKNSQLLAEVVYYDKDLENAARNRSASGSCCATR
ncbi:MAG: SurA N-terminal domain-containing protein [Desulfobacteraceae bacterium]|nr:SurA N-terminal domain-containing protein [Desulfobacteraceae bacterium]